MQYKTIDYCPKAEYLQPYNPKQNLWLIRWHEVKEGGEARTIEYLHQGKPTLEDIKQIITSWYNEQVDEAILSGHRYEGHLVWLSRENQINYKAAYDLAFQLEGQMGTLPATFKLGTDEAPHFRTFATLEDLQSFYLSTVQHIRACYQAGWEAKNKIDWTVYETTE